MFKKLFKAVSDSQSSIPEKRKGGENYLKDLVHVTTGGAAYPGQAGKTAETAPATEEAIITTAPEPAVTSESAALTEEEATTTEPEIATVAPPSTTTSKSATFTEKEISTPAVMIATDKPLQIAMLAYLAQNNISGLPPYYNRINSQCCINFRSNRSCNTTQQCHIKYSIITLGYI